MHGSKQEYYILSDPNDAQLLEQNNKFLLDLTAPFPKVTGDGYSSFCLWDRYKSINKMYIFDIYILHMYMWISFNLNGVMSCT